MQIIILLNKHYIALLKYALKNIIMKSSGPGGSLDQDADVLTVHSYLPVVSAVTAILRNFNTLYSI